MPVSHSLRLHPRVPALVVLASTCLASAAAAQRPAQIPSLDPIGLARTWDAEHVSPPVPATIDHADVTKRLDALASAAPDLFTIETIGESVHGRALRDVRVGSGPRVVLLWSQMHGDEPTATATLFDIFEYVRRHSDEPAVRRLLSELTLHFVPMLNPDGAERFERRNAQGIDVNRDALRLQTPEGRALKALRDRLQPMLGFNLHNQGWRTTVGTPPKPASITLLSVAFDEALTENPGRRLTKRVAAVIRDALEPFISGQIGRYDDEFEVRAFGDNVTLWGTPVLLIESGAYPSEAPDAALVRLNFVAILSALDAVASRTVDRADPKRYESLPVNEPNGLYIALRNATVINGAGVPPFTADVGVIAQRRLSTTSGRRELTTTLVLDDIGDLRTLGALREIDATGMTIVPLPDGDVQEGQIVALPEWRTVVETPLAVNQPARFAVLRPASEAGRYQVALIVR